MLSNILFWLTFDSGISGRLALQPSAKQVGSSNLVSGFGALFALRGSANAVRQKFGLFAWFALAASAKCDGKPKPKKWFGLGLVVCTGL